MNGRAVTCTQRRGCLLGRKANSVCLAKWSLQRTNHTYLGPGFPRSSGHPCLSLEGPLRRGAGRWGWGRREATRSGGPSGRPRRSRDETPLAAHPGPTRTHTRTWRSDHLQHSYPSQGQGGATDNAICSQGPRRLRTGRQVKRVRPSDTVFVECLPGARHCPTY